MKAKDLFQAGKLQEAIEALNVEIRDNPGDAQRRTFLFELLCFAGNFDRAEKQLNVLSGDNPQAGMGGLLYQSALHAERERQKLFETETYPYTAPPAKKYTGSFNGTPFETMEDADPRVGARLELFAAGQYMWIPFEQIESVEVGPPKRLRDLLWAPAIVRTGADFKGMELGEVLLPVIAPLSWKHPDDSVRLGRSTVWIDSDAADPVPAGQKLLLVDGEDIPFLELRHLEITVAESAAL